MDYLELLRKGAAQLGIKLSDEQKKQFDVYLKQLRFFNKKVNLTAVTEPVQIVKKHFLDSISVLVTKRIAPGQKVVDIGAGAGFPGLAIKIILPDILLVLVEANRKKSLFLDHMVDRLRLSDVSVANMRVEDFGSGTGREKFDVAVSRALSSLPVGLEYAMPCLKKEGTYLAMKGRLESEPSTEKACRELGCEIIETRKIEVPYLEGERNIVIFKKVVETPAKYPRRSGIPTKRPLIQ